MHGVLYGVYFILLGVIAAANLSWINAVYQVIFLISALLVGLHRTKANNTWQSYVTVILVWVLLADLVIQYGYYIRSFYLQLSLK